jgi:hypothetical protein
MKIGGEGGCAGACSEAEPYQVQDAWQRSPEPISKLGFWFQIKAAASFDPQEYIGISRTRNERPTTIWSKDFLRLVLCGFVEPGVRGRSLTEVEVSLRAYAGHGFGLGAGAWGPVQRESK